MSILAWGARVSPEFRAKAREGCADLGIDPSWLMACMAFESGESFRPDVRNAAGSGAVGLIQFMPATAAALGTTIGALCAMTAEAQLDVVMAFFRPHAGRLRNLGDVYMAILWPDGIGRTDEEVLFDRTDPHHPARYVQNAGLDLNRDGRISRGEACARVTAKLSQGLEPRNASTL
jgi:hypothetical protein